MFSLYHVICFFKGAWLSFSGSICFAHLLGMLGSNQYCINSHFFLTEFMITLFFLMQWHMSKQTFFIFYLTQWDIDLYYLMLSVIKSPLLRILWYNCIFTYRFFDKLFTWAKVCHISNRCSFGQHKHHVNMSLICASPTRSICTTPICVQVHLTMFHQILSEIGNIYHGEKWSTL